MIELLKNKIGIIKNQWNNIWNSISISIVKWKNVYVRIYDCHLDWKSGFVCVDYYEYESCILAVDTQVKSTMKHMDWILRSKLWFIII